MINSKAFARAYSNKYGVPFKFAIHDCEKFWELLAELLYGTDENITIYGVGSFQRKKTKPKVVRHPATKELMTIPENTVIKFIETSRVIAGDSGQD